MSDQSFLGQGWAFPPQFNLMTKEVELSRYEKDIKESLFILLSTAPGERIMQPDFGCSIKHMVFESVSNNFLTMLEDAVEQAILFFESRIDLEEIRIEQSDEEERDGILNIFIDYTIIETNSRSNIVYPFYYIEGTHVPV